MRLNTNHHFGMLGQQSRRLDRTVHSKEGTQYVNSMYLQTPSNYQDNALNNIFVNHLPYSI